MRLLMSPIRPTILVPRAGGFGLGDRLWDLAGVAPSLDQRFAESRSLIDAVSGQQLITFTRASDGTFVGSNGLIQAAGTNVPRFTHDPVTGESLGLLVEEQRANLLLQSEDFSTTWSRPQSDTITTNSIAAPNSATTADSFVENTTASSLHTLVQDATIVANSTNTVSIFLKAAGRTEVQIKLSSVDDANGCQATFNLSANTVTSGAFGTGSGAAASITAFSSGWYRCVLTGAIGSSLTTARIRIRPFSGGSDTYTGSGAVAYYLWGAQLEAGAFATSYIPTTTATVTRSADVVSITGSAFSSWYRQDEGTIFIEGIMAPVVSRFPTEWALHDGTALNSIQAYNFTNAYAATVRKTGEANTDPTLSATVASGILYRKAVAIRAANYRIAANGTEGASVNPAFIPSVDRITLGSNPTGGGNLNAPIRRLSYWPRRLDNTTLQALTQ
jgi:hypothetical protein